MKKILYSIVFLTLLSCTGQSKPVFKTKVSLIVLGTVQDAGSPHIGCEKKCCSALFLNQDTQRKVVSLGLVDHENKQMFLFEATPDITAQLKSLKEYSKTNKTHPNGIFLTHAHIGHYTGLQYLGREALGAKNVKVYAMPKMKVFLEQNGPWNQLVNLKNITIQNLENDNPKKLTNNIKVVPFLVPHRDEYSETVGYKIFGPNKSLLFIPDIDKWTKWKKSIVEEIQKVDYAFLDATFFDAKEINNRDISEIPHPFIVESMELFNQLSKNEKQKVHFIHLNHTNPVLNQKSEEAAKVFKEGFKIASFGQIIKL